MITRILFSMQCIMLCTLSTYAQQYLYVSDAGNFQNGPYQILRYNEDGSNGEVFINKMLNWPQDILFLEDQKVVLISNLGSNSINRHDAYTGDFISTFATGISGPTRIKIGKDGYLYVLQWSGDGMVKRYDLDGNFVDDFTKTGVGTSIGIDWDKDGNLYVSSYNGKFVERFDSEGNTLGKFIATGLAGPTNIQFLDNGDLMVLDYNSGFLKLYDADGNFIKNIEGGLGQCEGLHIFPDGSFVIGVGQTSSVNSYDNTGSLIKKLVPNGANNLLNPNAVVFQEGFTSPVNEVANQNISFLQAISVNEYKISEEALAEKIDLLQVFDAQGKTVLTQHLNDNPLVQMDKFAAGIYFAKAAIKNKGIWTQKIIVVK